MCFRIKEMSWTLLTSATRQSLQNTSAVSLHKTWASWSCWPPALACPRPPWRNRGHLPPWGYLCRRGLTAFTPPWRRWAGCPWTDTNQLLSTPRQPLKLQHLQRGFSGSYAWERTAEKGNQILTKLQSCSSLSACFSDDLQYYDKVNLTFRACRLGDRHYTHDSSFEAASEHRACFLPTV